MFPSVLTEPYISAELSRLLNLRAFHFKQTCDNCKPLFCTMYSSPFPGVLFCQTMIDTFRISLNSFHFTKWMPLLILSRFSQCNQRNFWCTVYYPHLHFHWWTCYHCHLEERWGCDNTQHYPPANQEISWSCWRCLPDNAHHWSFSLSEWHFGDIQLHSGKCQRRIFKNSKCTRWVLNLCTFTCNIPCQINTQKANNKQIWIKLGSYIVAGCDIHL